MPPLPSLAGCIFDLDGVIVDTAKYHFLAWQRLAREFGYDFTETENEKLKGVSRTDSLEIILELAGIQKTSTQKDQLCAQKNEWYLEYIHRMQSDEILPGAISLLQELRNADIKISLGSASKNAPLILDILGITNLFDAIVDGNSVNKAKPDPEVFTRAAELLQTNPRETIVFEDAPKGIAAAKAAGMMAIGIGQPEYLAEADLILPNFIGFDLSQLLSSFDSYCKNL